MQNGYKPPRPGIHMGAQQAMNAGTGGLHHPVSQQQGVAPGMPSAIDQMMRARQLGSMPHPMTQGLVGPSQVEQFIDPHRFLPNPTPRGPVMPHEYAYGRAGMGHVLSQIPGMMKPVQVEHGVVPLRSGASGVGAPGAGILAAMMNARGGQ